MAFLLWWRNLSPFCAHFTGSSLLVFLTLATNEMTTLTFLIPFADWTKTLPTIPSQILVHDLFAVYCVTFHQTDWTMAFRTAKYLHWVYIVGNRSSRSFASCFEMWVARSLISFFTTQRPQQQRLHPSSFGTLRMRICWSAGVISRSISLSTLLFLASVYGRMPC